jgi:hypothetical protein
MARPNCRGWRRVAATVLRWSTIRGGPARPARVWGRRTKRLGDRPQRGQLQHKPRAGRSAALVREPAGSAPGGRAKPPVALRAMAGQLVTQIGGGAGNVRPLGSPRREPAGSTPGGSAKPPFALRDYGGNLLRKLVEVPGMSGHSAALVENPAGFNSRR